MSPAPLGRLTRITDLRGQWPGEATHFTPWLAEEDNIALLGDTLGIELEVEAVEQNVGPFRADILAKDTATNGWVLIENQLERTDHTHLGQLMTYAAGLDAVTIVWIAAKVQADHRKAMDWLNEITDETFRFFALEIELWKIGDSMAAPKFNVICQPNDWQKSTAQARRAVDDGDRNSLRKVQRAYWERLEERFQRTTTMQPATPQAKSWTNRSLGKSGVNIRLAMNTQAKWLRAMIYLTGDQAKARFAYLQQHVEDAEEVLGFSMIQRNEPSQNHASFFVTMDADPLDEADHPRQHEWLVTTAEKMDEVFRPLIAQLDRDADTP